MRLYTVIAPCFQSRCGTKAVGYSRLIAFRLTNPIAAIAQPCAIEIAKEAEVTVDVPVDLDKLKPAITLLVVL